MLAAMPQYKAFGSKLYRTAKYDQCLIEI